MNDTMPLLRCGICLQLILMGLISCTFPTKVPTQHIVMFDSDGTPVDPTGNVFETRHSTLASYPHMPEADYQQYLETLISNVKNSPTKDGKRKILLFFHGGMNSQVASLERVIEPVENNVPLYETIIQEGFYPIFVNWKSSLWSSYFEHLFRIRQGEQWPVLPGIVSSLVVFPVDVGRSIMRLPLTWARFIGNDISTIYGIRGEPSFADDVAKEAICRTQYGAAVSECLNMFKWTSPPYCIPWAIWDSPPQRPPQRSAGEAFLQSVEVGEDQRRCWKGTIRFLRYFPTLPTKLLVAPVLDTFGTSAWDNMLRRIQLLYRKESEVSPWWSRSSAWSFNKRKQEGALADMKPTGGLAIFLDRLQSAMDADRSSNPGIQWDITLVGHSAGTIIINQLVKEYGDKLPISSIVYMAAAAKIRDTEESLYPYIERRNGATKFYTFMLHKQAEAGESNYADLPPRGSLLMWIDHFLANPLTPFEKTYGRHENFFPVLYGIPESIRPHVNVRTFGVGPAAEATTPHSHSEMATRFRFWKPHCWSADAPLHGCVIP